MASPTFLVNTLLTPGKQLFDLVAGQWQKAHEEGCAGTRAFSGSGSRSGTPW